VSPQADFVGHAGRPTREVPIGDVACRVSTTRRGTIVTATYVRRSEIVSLLRSRGKFARADWFERTLPDVVDTGENSSLLANLEIDAEVLTSTDRIPQNA
jgi:hypothetical protein